jgi:alkylhydroperoxidase family enzyme
MTPIDPVSPAELEAAGLGELVEKAEALGVPDARFLGILAHAPGYAEALFDAMYRSHTGGTVDHRLKEIIRIQLARLAGDGYFAGLRSKVAMAQGLDEERIEAGCGDFEHDARFTVAEKWALSYAWLMYRAPNRLDAAFYDRGKALFSEAQIMELGAFIAMHYGMQVFMATLTRADEDSS